MPQRQRYAHHAFAAYQTDFQRQMAVRECQQRLRAMWSEEHLPDDLARLVEHVAEHELDRFENRQQTPGGREGKRCEQAVFDHSFGFILEFKVGTGHAHVCAATYLSRN